MLLLAVTLPSESTYLVYVGWSTDDVFVRNKTQHRGRFLSSMWPDAYSLKRTWKEQRIAIPVSTSQVIQICSYWNAPPVLTPSHMSLMTTPSYMLSFPLSTTCVFCSLLLQIVSYESFCQINMQQVFYVTHLICKVM